MPRANIIIVEDEAITAFDLQVRLEGMGYFVPAVASTGDDALSIAELHRPDLMLMDIRLRGEKDGIEVAQLIRERFDIPIIYLTAFADDATIDRARVTEPFGYLIKPFQEQELYSSVEMALYKHKAERTLRENERRLQVYSQRLQTLHSIEQSILGADSPHDIAHAVLQSLGKLIPFNTALVLTFDSHQQTAHILAGYPVGHLGLDAVSLTIEGASFCTELQSGNPLFVQTVELFDVLPRLEHMLPDNENSIYANIPLQNQGELIGVLTIGTNASQPYDDTQLAILSELANSLALAIHHSSLHQAVANHAEELAQRNLELDAFAHTVAHDLKTPIGVIIGYGDVLLEDEVVEIRTDLQKYFGIIARTGRKMNDIVNELLLLAEIRKQDVHRDPLDMESIVEHAQSRLCYAIANVSAEIFLPSAWPMACGYGPWVEEVWVNYINNALKYGGYPPKIWLGADAQKDDSTGALYYRFWVQDNGNGITPDEQKVLFTPFTRINQALIQGHGLGLSIVQGIVSKLGGQVGMESTGIPGQGCLFFFTLPAFLDNDLSGESDANR